VAKTASGEPDRNGPPGPERKLSALDRAILQAIGDGIKVGRDDDPARERFPALWEWLTKTEGGRDYILQPATITIALGPEGVLCSVTFRDLQRSCKASCLSLEDAFQALEDALTSPNALITSWGRGEPRLRKRKQK